MPTFTCTLENCKTINSAPTSTEPFFNKQVFSVLEIFKNLSHIHKVLDLSLQ